MKENQASPIQVREACDALAASRRNLKTEKGRTYRGAVMVQKKKRFMDELAREVRNTFRIV
ncbi:hypothetical protein [Maritalea mediterranea]|uniref:Uncharacterized protein n=1 Tax=Maritalea mediterranea TaxID=2909667 RepID=A0ABS9EED5_9HYPH|nr:hypothetical protein [Maritalea mediterranea]MCF4099811.1 hypothetical protein [Maritalea mediterranea]